MIIFSIIRQVFFFTHSFRRAIRVISRSMPTVLRDRLLFQYAIENRKRNAGKILTLGHGYMMRMAEESIALFSAAQKAGFSKKEAYLIVREVVWLLAETAATVTNAMRFIISDPGKRIRTINNLLWSTVWTKPFKREGMKLENNVYSFDVVQCPVSEYFKANDAVTLCEEVFCSADYRFSEVWGTTFKREQTIASGCQKCDFAFTIKNQETCLKK